MRNATVIALAVLGIAALLAVGAQAQMDQLPVTGEQSGVPASSAVECDAAGAVLLDGFSAIAPDEEGALSVVEGLGGPEWAPVVQEEPCGTYYPGATRTTYECTCSGPRLRKLVDQEYCNACGCTWVRVSSSCTWIPCAL